ncbi:MAG TPA: DMT family transporter [Gammaproteobacteria bacterium]|nr:DMT family transporter [Gammaproteobacteria bacterium]
MPADNPVPPPAPPDPPQRTGRLGYWDQLPANVRGVVFVMAGGFLLIVMASIVKQLGSSLPAVQILFVRSLAGLIVILPLIWKLGFSIVKSQRMGLHLMRGTVGFVGNVCFFFALINLTIGDTVTIQFSRPLIMVVFAAIFLGEAVGARRAVTTAVGFLGVLIITRPFGEGFNPWVFSAVGGAVFGSLVVVCVKLLSRTESTPVIMFYYALYTTLFSLIPALFVWEAPTTLEWGLLFLTGALSIVGQGMFTHGVGLGETSFVMPFDYLRIVYSFLIGFILFAEVPGIWSITGACVIVAASVYLLRLERTKAKD